MPSLSDTPLRCRFDTDAAAPRFTPMLMPLRRHELPSVKRERDERSAYALRAQEADYARGMLLLDVASECCYAHTRQRVAVDARFSRGARSAALRHARFAEASAHCHAQRARAI